jgi:hypothetical protein
MHRLDFLRILAVAMAAPKVLINKEPDLHLVAGQISMSSGDTLTIYGPKGQKIDKEKIFIYASTDGRNWTRQTYGEVRDNELHLQCWRMGHYKVYTTPYSQDNGLWSLND